MKLYTRTGDGGDTSLFGGTRVRKDDARVRAYGAVDEANSAIGFAASASDLGGDVREALLGVMSDLLDAGSELATPADAQAKKLLDGRLRTRVTDARVAEIEAKIDWAEARVPPLATFVLPTGCEAAARLHLARTAVRRAEREVVGLSGIGEALRPELLKYLNRLSDLCFALARLCNVRSGHGDVPWDAGKKT